MADAETCSMASKVYAIINLAGDATRTSQWYFCVLRRIVLVCLRSKDFLLLYLYILPVWVHLLSLGLGTMRVLYWVGGDVV